MQEEIEQKSATLMINGTKFSLRTLKSAALKLLVALSQPIDAFFDGVMVMCENEAVRMNRLSLLESLLGLFGRIARFASLAV